MEKELLKIDFGSGYNPNKDYKTCDITFSPTLDFAYDITGDTIIGLEIASVDEFYIRNVVHHLKDMKRTFSCLKRYLKKGGIIKIIDVREEFFLQNVILDIIWYRYVIPRYEIWFSTQYRNYHKELEDLDFELIEQYYEAEKEVSVWKIL